MQHKMEFSIASMKACTGNAISDADYLKWFLQKCDARLSSAAKDIGALVDGGHRFDAQTIADARAQRAQVRFCVRALGEFATWFAAKPEIAKRFADVLDERKNMIEATERNFLTLNGWFET